jgi:membrane-bound ClpP family serine protease
MRKALNIVSIVFLVLGVAFTILPMGTIALLPIGLTVLTAAVSFWQSKDKQRILPRIVLVLSVITFLVVIGKDVFVKDEVKVDQQFEQKKIESQKEDMKDLEGL